jgi:hypothetical protein
MTKPIQAATRQQSSLDAFKLRAAKDLVKLHKNKAKAIDTTTRRHNDIEADWWCTVPAEMTKDIESIARGLEDEAQKRADDEDLGTEQNQ